MEPRSDDDSKAFVFRVKGEKNEKIYFPSCEILLDNKPVKVLVDLCAPYTLISEKVFAEMMTMHPYVNQTLNQVVIMVTLSP